MNEMAHSAGDADRELEIFAESLPYKLNRLKETGTGIWQTILNRGRRCGRRSARHVGSEQIARNLKRMRRESPWLW